MDPIDSVSRAMQLLRRRLSNPQGRASASAPETLIAADGGSARPSVRESVATRLGALDADDPSYLDRATEAFVESVLLSEFGDELTNDPQFRQLILGVSRDLRADAATAADLERLFQSTRQA
jgi:hypothetical protein